MPLTKKEARAIVNCERKIQAALDACLPQLSDGQRSYAENYWAAHMKKLMDGYSYGSMPISEAEHILDI